MSMPQGLIIEDNADAQLLFEDILDLCGVAHDTIGNGEQAIAFLQDHTPDIMLVDMHLPGAHGVQIVKSIRANKALDHAIVLVVSADHMMSSSVEDLVDAVILKPIDVTDVKILIERLLASRIQN